MTGIESPPLADLVTVALFFATGWWLERTGESRGFIDCVIFSRFGCLALGAAYVLMRRMAG